MPTRWYAIHLPAEHRGVYNDWEDVQWRVKGQLSKYKSFGTRQEASFWSIKGRELTNKPENASTQLSSLSRWPLQPLVQTQWQQPSRAPVREKPEQPDGLAKPAARIQESIKDEGEPISSQDVKCEFSKFYAVAVGRVPGVYEAWDGPRGAREQVDRFSKAQFQGFDRLHLARDYIQQHGVPECDIRFFRRHFAERPDFKPDPSASFNDQFEQLASSQNLSQPEKRVARVGAIRDELISYYLPGGIPIDQVDENGEIELKPDQTLQIYQEMCRHTDKLVGVTSEGCLLSLKLRPFVNIINLIDANRAKQEPKLFHHWREFVKYTKRPGNMIPMQEALKNEFLAPLLQNLRKGPIDADLERSGHKFLSKHECRTPPRLVEQRFETPEPDIKKEEITSSLPMLSPTQFSPICSPEPESPASDLSDYGDDLEVALDLKPAVDVKLEPSAPQRWAQTQPTTGAKRNHSMVDDSLEVIPETPRKHGRFTQ
ncbi:hypothetical protein HBH98_032530 [Parastagonospora nodorum]|nr:hypothetical protein HBH49_051450 [Parastagonospora nodorum]KAH4123646.1 hypothetical protein HBH47_074600 [Parastagonospora nodorum]KAH4205206.1 hypothetical protein HBI95_134800 [Parastagonospora nodorum]KAH4219563.1 hypothetical protein HBI06_182630 [Parastagonospora nodorum]KAH4241084.1 hypothetical protein HBI05_104580 [Parastagonospora nodorum]